MTEPDFALRRADAADLPALRTLMDAAIGALQAPFLSPEQVLASFSIMGLDTQLVADGGYFIVESGGRIAGCGGWSRRATLFGGDHSAGRDAALLDPATDAARMRAMYTHPDFVRRGVGRTILSACEAAAAADGFKRCELAATLAGEPLYLACGYRQIERFDARTPQGVEVPLVRMGKSLNSPPQ
jgi:GNAT superfamily N-acetyltransferase